MATHGEEDGAQFAALAFRITALSFFEEVWVDIEGEVGVFHSCAGSASAAAHSSYFGRGLMGESLMKIFEYSKFFLGSLVEACWRGYFVWKCERFFGGATENFESECGESMRSSLEMDGNFVVDGHEASCLRPRFC